MKVKKFILFILLTVLILSICNVVNAVTTYNVEIVSNDEQTIQKGQTVEIKIKVKDIVDIVDGVAGFSAKLEYDTTKLEKVGVGEGLNGFLLVEGDTIELAKYPGITSETEIAKFTFKCIEVGEAQIKLTNVEVANGTDNFKLGKDITKSISIVSSNNVVNDNDNNNNNNNDNDADSRNNENNSNNGNNASGTNNGNNANNGNNGSDENSKESTPEDIKVFPKTGINTTILISFCLIMGIVATISFVKIKKFAKIK